MFNIGPAEVMVVLLIALIVLGPSKLPDAARQVGRAIGEMRKLSSGSQAEMRDALKEPVDGKPSSAGSTAKGGGALSAPNAGTPVGDATTVGDAPAGDATTVSDAVPAGDATTVSDAGPAPGGTVDAPAAAATAAAPAPAAPAPAPATSAEPDTTRQSSVGAPAGGAPGEANEPENNGTTPN